VKTRAEKTGRNISKNTIKFLHTTFLLQTCKSFLEGVKQITKQNNIHKINDYAKW
jgi:hypothetical protein